MIELIQFPWSPFCLAQRRLLEFAQVPFKIINIPTSDRTLVWRLTRQRYYQVPIIKNGKTVVFETDEDSQVIAKYLDDKLRLGLFPRVWDGVQTVLWRYFEQEIEEVSFKLNDIYYQEFVPAKERLNYLRHKERKFGRRCLDRWREQQAQLQSDLARRLLPCEEMLLDKPFLLGQQPLFVDFDLYGVVANYLFSGHNELPAAYTCLQQWYRRMANQRRSTVTPGV
jgi:glutathione S-transferase